MGQAGADGSGESAGDRRYVARAGRLDRDGGVPSASSGCREGTRGGLRGRRGAVDLGAFGLGRGPGRAQPGPGGGGARLVPRRPSRERGPGGPEVRQGDATGALPPPAEAPEEGEEQGHDRGTGGDGRGTPRGFARLARDPLPEEARRGATAALRCLPVLAPADGERRDREHDPPRDQPPAQGEQHLLDGGERGGGLPTPGRGRLGSVGRDRRAYAGGDGTRSSHELALDASGLPRGIESAGSRGRREDASFDFKTD